MEQIQLRDNVGAKKKMWEAVAVSRQCPLPTWLQSQKHGRTAFTDSILFSNVAECLNALASRKHGKVPDEKTVLETSKVKRFVSKYIAHLVILLFQSADQFSFFI